jgi:hypothetical protein
VAIEIAGLGARASRLRREQLVYPKESQPAAQLEAAQMGVARKTFPIPFGKEHRELRSEEGGDELLAIE